VNGVYASRRHCEIWLDQGVWWVTDNGSTNGIRVERGASVLGRSASSAKQGSESAVVEITAGARIVLSAYGDGDPKNYPRLMLDVGRDATAATPIAPAIRAHPTPSTPIVAARPRESGWSFIARMASGARTVELDAGELPFSVRTLARTGARRRLGARGRVGASHRHHRDRRERDSPSSCTATTACASPGHVPAGRPAALEVRRVDRARPRHRARAGVRTHVVAQRSA
jgi:predicted component of type VI protein secretion system